MALKQDVKGNLTSPASSQDICVVVPNDQPNPMTKSSAESSSPM